MHAFCTQHKPQEKQLNSRGNKEISRSRSSPTQQTLSLRRCVPCGLSFIWDCCGHRVTNDTALGVKPREREGRRKRGVITGLNIKFICRFSTFFLLRCGFKCFSNGIFGNQNLPSLSLSLCLCISLSGTLCAARSHFSWGRQAGAQVNHPHLPEIA